MGWAEGPGLKDACTSLAADLGLRVTVLGADGWVQCDSGRAGGTSASISDLPEVRAALAAGTGTAVRADGQGGEPVAYAAARQSRDGATRVVRTALRACATDDTVSEARWLLAAGPLAGALPAAGAAPRARPRPPPAPPPPGRVR